MKATVPVILSGGSGTRLWPLSRRLAPKQLQRLTGSVTMLQSTLERVADINDEPIVIANVDHVNEIRLQLPPSVRLVEEPVARNTAPAVAAAALMVDRDDVLVVLPADHHIEDTERFRQALAAGVEGASQGYLVTFGVVPNRPETGYGYIIAGESQPPGHVVERFVEKPDLATATTLIAEGALWNGGMFAFRAGDLIDELESHVPGMVENVGAALKSGETRQGSLVLGDEFAQADAVSIDVAVMEKTTKGMVIALDAGWSDAGSWESLHELGPRDDRGNVIVGDVVVDEVAASYIRSEGPLVAALGVQNLIIVATADAVLVTTRDRAQDVKTLVEQLENRTEVSDPPKLSD